MNHQTSSVPQISYQSPQVSTQPITESPLIDSAFAIPVFSPRDDPITCLNKAMAFLTAVASSRFPSTNNQLRTLSNPKNQATIQDGRVAVQQVQGRQGQFYSGTSYKSNATSSGETILVDRQRRWINLKKVGFPSRKATCDLKDLVLRGEVKDKMCIFAMLKHVIEIVQAVIERASKDGEIVHEYFD
ncbi:hypothetical protein Tco_0985791 [Tanacetum coccineum]